MPKGRILAVDDQRYFRELIEGLLAEEGYEAQTAASGEEALRILEHSAFDVVLTDLVMPGMDGSELVHRVKERNPDQDIVVVTGVVDVKTAVDAMKLGATDYLLKPFDRTALAASIEGILKRRRLRAEHARLLAENIEYLGERSLFDRALGLFSCLSVQPLAQRLIEGLCVETRAQGGVLWVAHARGGARLGLASARGLVRVDEEPEELEVEELPQEIREDSVRSSICAWSSGDRGEDSESQAIYLPLRRDGRVIGLARLSDKLNGDEFDLVDTARAEKFAGFAEVALGNALRVRDLERRSLEDPSTGAYSFEYFQDVVRTELERANRFGRRFSVLKLDLAALLPAWDDDAEGHPRRAEMVQQVRRLLRATDLIAVEGENRFCVLLAEVDALGAAVLRQRAQRVLDGSGLDADPSRPPRVRARLAVATYPGDGTQLESLLRVLDERLEQERNSTVRCLGLEGAPFADNLRTLLAEGETDRVEVPEQVVRFVLGEVGRRARDRALLFVAPGAPLAGVVQDGLEQLRGISAATEIAVIADREGWPQHIPSVTWVSRERAPGLPPFLIYYGEGPAYALVRDEKEIDGETRFFHTGDRSLVAHLAFRLQAEISVPASIDPVIEDEKQQAEVES